MRSRFEIQLAHAAEIIGGRVTGGDVTVHAVTTDSREAEPGDLYIALHGERFDGHDFLEELARGGKIAAFVSERDYTDLHVPCILCSNTRHALGALAADHRSALTIPVIGITGTNGKTTTKELVSCALSSRYRVHRNQKNFNNDIGVPFTLFDCTADHTAAVIEMGMNHAGEISYLSSLVMPDVSIITNADAGHLEFLGSVEEVAHAKSEIFESMAEGATVFINRDTITYDILEENAKKRKLDVVSYGFSDAADLRMDGYTLGKDFTEVVYKGVPCRVLLYGIHNVANVLVSMAVAEHFGVSPGESARALAAFRNESMRNQITETDFTLINDAYNANPLSMRGALESMSLVFPDRRKIAVLGDMKELGAGVGKFHEELGAQCAVYKTDMVFLYGDHAADVARGARSAGMDSGSIFVYKEKHDLVKSLKDTVVDGDVVLVKGSRSMKMEEVADALVCC